MTKDDLIEVLAQAPIVPVLTVEALEDAAPLALALQKGGLKVLEVTFRTPSAPQIIYAMKQACPELIVGAGTVLNDRDVEAAMNAGADFLVSPGSAFELLKAVSKVDIPLIPGVATPTEAMNCYECGFNFLKLFPAEIVGGAKLLKAMAAPLPHLKFMPTGGVKQETAGSYLSLPNVVAVGGTWIATPDDISEGQFDVITTKAVKALSSVD